jgi:ribosomal protein L11 methyltransferase
MPWKRLSIVVTDTQAEPLGDLMSEFGAVSVSVEPDQEAGSVPIFEPGPGETPIWKVARVTGLFDADSDLGPVIAAANTDLALPQKPDWQTDTLADKAWERVWMDDFHPLKMGERLWICPSWLQAPDPNAVNVLMDPGLAFGSGTHPTTAMCLQWLDAHISGGEQLIDFGCGSGILAIAALKLGASHALGIDNDPQAITASRENARRNEVEHRLSTCLAADLDSTAPEPSELLVANILAAPLIELAPQLIAMVRPGGQLVLSGILDTQAGEVAARYALDFKLDPIAHDHEWVRISGTRKP